MAYGAQDCNENIMIPFNRFWRRTPPALFPSLLGLFGLALAWRQAADVWGIPREIGESIGLVSTVILLITLTSYVAKLCIRPSVLWDDLQIGPARGSVSAGSMCAMAMAAFFIPYTSLGAALVWYMALGLHAVYFTCVVLIVARHENTLEQISPVILLPVVGVLVATLAAPQMGYIMFCKIVLAFAIPISAVIFVISLWNARRVGVPVPHRSSFAIFLVPPSLAALCIFAIGGPAYYLPVWLGVTGIAFALLPFVRWMAHGGWSPAWGAFAFPLAAFCSVQIVAVEAEFGWVAQILAVSTLIVASVLIPYIVARTYISWFQGKLAEVTKAAVA
jgi:tellurite resistance protein